MKKIIVIGAGMGGIASALRLRHAGFRVTVLEKQTRPGGRSNLLQESGFRADTGPTIMVMKAAFEEMYESIGYDLNQRLELVKLDPNYRIYYHDGSRLDLYSDMAHLAQEVNKIQSGGAEQLFHFIGESARKYELGMDFVERNYDRITDLANITAGIRLLQTQAHQNLYKQVDRYFNGNDKLTKAFSFHSMFLGLSPFDALAMYSLITYAALALGMWFPMGGIYSLIEDMVQLCEEMGVDIHTNCPVEKIEIKDERVSGVHLSSGEFMPADIVVSNADLPYSYKHLIDASFRYKYTDNKLDKMQYSCSGYILFLGIDRVYDDVHHQGLYFSEDYRANLEAIFNTKTLPEDPSFHLNIPTVTDPSLAPPGHSLIYVLAPMPNLEARIDWAEAGPRVRLQLIERLEQIIDPQISQHIVWEKDYRPTDWQNDINATLGTAFGSLSHGFFQSSYFRPHNRAEGVRGLYFVGQGTYPGIGMPMVMISSRLVTERITTEWM